MSNLQAKMDLSNDNSACTSEESNDSGTLAKGQKVTKRMAWDNEKDLLLIGEVILARPFSYRAGTRERGKAWQEVADRLQTRALKVDKRAVRDRITHLMDKQKSKNRQEKAASGISVEETDEEKRIRESIEDFLQEEEDIESSPKQKADEAKKKTEGTEMRKRACETFGETNRRHQEESSSTTPKRSRNSGSETLSFLQRKMEMEQEFRREEMTRKREEEERRKQDERERERKFELLQQQQGEQQQQFQQFMQQQAQQTQAMMMTLINLLEKKDSSV